MKKFFTLLRYVPKRATFIGLLTLGVVAPAAAFAWGPTENRDTFTIKKPASYVTFNSITDNPNIGDERNFVGIRQDGTNSAWSDSMTVESGKTYVVRLYVHNDAGANYNLTAKDVTAKVNLPTTTAKSIDVFGFISASNSSPKEVYDQATFKASQNFNLAYVANSLTYENNYFTNGVGLSENIFTSTGVKLGYKKLDGSIKGCMQYAGYVTFKVKPQFATVKPAQTPAPAPTTSDFTIQKDVRIKGTSQWSDSVNGTEGDTVQYRVTYKNTGTTTQKNVVLQDMLPASLTYVAGSSNLTNATHSNGVKTSDNVVTSNGLNIGTLAKGTTATLTFEARETQALNCNSTLYATNTIKATSGSVTKSDSAQLTVSKTCQTTTPAPAPTTPAAPAQPTPTTPAETTPVAPAAVTVEPVAVAAPAPAPVPQPTPVLTATGPTQLIGGLIGTSSLGLGAHHYLASRRALRNARKG